MTTAPHAPTPHAPAPHAPARSDLPRRELVPPPAPKELAHLAGRATLATTGTAGDHLPPVDRPERLARAFGQGLVSAYLLF